MSAKRALTLPAAPPKTIQAVGRRGSHHPTAYLSLCPVSFRRRVDSQSESGGGERFLRRGAQKSRACGLLLALLRRALGLGGGGGLLSSSLSSGLLGSGHFRGSFSNDPGPQAFSVISGPSGHPTGKEPLANRQRSSESGTARRRAAGAARHPCRLSAHHRKSRSANRDHRVRCEHPCGCGCDALSDATNSSKQVIGPCVKRSSTFLRSHVEFFCAPSSRAAHVARRGARL